MNLEVKIGYRIWSKDDPRCGGGGSPGRGAGGSVHGMGQLELVSSYTV